MKVYRDREHAQAISLKALGYLAGNEAAFARFLAATGLDIADLKTGASDPGFLAGILDYFLQDEALLLAFAGASELAPQSIVSARQHLPGALND